MSGILQVLRKPEEHLIVKLTASRASGLLDPASPTTATVVEEERISVLAGSVGYEALAATLPKFRFGREGGIDLSLRGLGPLQQPARLDPSLSHSTE